MIFFFLFFFCWGGAQYINFYLPTNNTISNVLVTVQDFQFLKDCQFFLTLSNCLLNTSCHVIKSTKALPSYQVTTPHILVDYSLFTFVIVHLARLVYYFLVVVN